jgi:hypothetical protein
MKTDVLFEFSGGSLDGEQVLKKDWPQKQTLPGTEILDKPTGQLYRYSHKHSTNHPVYTHRPKESA